MRTVVCLLKLLTLAAGLMVSRAAAQELAVVVNKSNPIDNLTAVQLRRILLAEQSQWPNGKPVMVLLRTPGAPEREVAIQIACGMTETDFNQHFLHSGFNGGNAAAPKALGSAAMLRQLVTTLPGAIGILAAADVNDSVKVVKFEGLSPGDSAYKLKK
jgi:ABC-type phosphate transport system substrate-binding protein